MRGCGCTRWCSHGGNSALPWYDQLTVQHEAARRRGEEIESAVCAARGGGVRLLYCTLVVFLYLELCQFKCEIDGTEYAGITTTADWPTGAVYPRAREKTAKPAQHSRVATSRYVK